MRPHVVPVLATVLLAGFAPAQRSVPDTPKTTDKQTLRQGLTEARLQMADAIQKALEQVPGHAISATFQRARIDGQLVPRFEIEILKGDEFYEVHVDAGSGAVTRAERHGAAAASRTGEMVFEFEQDGLPPGFTPKETAGAGTMATWTVVPVEGAPDGKRVVVVDTPNKRGTFNLLERRGRVGPDLVLSTRVQAWKGQEDQGGGLFWRAKDTDNYYIARWNPLEKNLRLYTVENGKRSLPLKSAEVDGDAAAWHEIEVTAVGPRIVVRFDGKIVLEAEDATFPAAGNLGLWTKADASSRFDSLRVQPQKQ